MDQKRENKTEKTLGFIAQDRIVPDDPWFYSRLMARLGREEAEAVRRDMHIRLYRLRPVLIGLCLLVIITLGAGMGRMMIPEKQPTERDLLSGLPASDVTAVLFQEVSGTFDEQILLMK